MAHDVIYIKPKEGPIGKQTCGCSDTNDNDHTVILEDDK